MLRKVRLYGQLAEFVGRKVVEADLGSVAEAVRMLVVNFPGLEQHMSEGHYKVLVGDGALTLDELHYPTGQQEIKIVPVISGAGGGPTTQILAGVAIIGLSFGIGAIASAGVALGGLAGIGTVGTAFVALGTSLVLGGVAGLISPTPEIPQGPDTEQDPRKSASYSFSGVQNTSRAGTPVPIVYGKTLTGSVVISAGVDTVQIQS
jgi:predicted phage tail protein